MSEQEVEEEVVDDSPSKLANSTLAQHDREVQSGLISDRFLPDTPAQSMTHDSMGI